MGEDEAPRRRRRRRGARGEGPERAPVPGPEAAPGAAPGGKRKPRAASDPAERGLRDLVGAGRSQVGVNGALRARDVNRPTDEDIAEAEATLTIVRRHWTPPADRPVPGTPQS